MATLKTGSIVTVGTGADAFKMVVANVTAKLVTGPHADGIGMVTAPLADVSHIGKASSKAKDLIAKLEAAKAEPVVVKASKVKGEKAVKATRTRAGGATKLEKALALAKANPELTRMELIQMFVDELEMTAAGASTYVSTVRKALKA